MANDLQSYVEKFILNHGTSIHLDEDGLEIESGQVIDKLEGNEAPSTTTSVSKLRMRNDVLLSDNNPKYDGNKVTRASLGQDQYDPQLAKLCMVNTSDVDNLSDEDSNLTDENNSEVHDSNDDILGHSDSGMISDDDHEFGVDSSNDKEDANGEESDIEDDDQLDNNADSTENEAISGQLDILKKLMSDGNSDEFQKSQAVHHQIGLFDSLFTLRILLQKLMVSMKKFPTPDVYPAFIQQNDSNYLNNLKKCRKTSKNLMNSLVELQNFIIKTNNETRHILTDKKINSKSKNESDEEITSSEDEDVYAVPKLDSSTTKKRKFTSEECEGHLSKRFAGLVQFRDGIYSTWYEKTKLLSTHKSQSSFEKFEISALQQLKNILNDKPLLIQRTQLSSMSRGNTARTLGSEINDQTEFTDEYHAEIFDDSDFYKRMLEDVVKSKVSMSDNMIDVSRKWIEIQNLRKKVKKNLDTKASKGRKTRYDVMSKMQQFMAPSKPSTMDNLAINTLFRSLFGNAIQKN